MPLGAVARCDWLPLHLSTWAPGGVRPSPELQSWSREAPLRSSVHDARFNTQHVPCSCNIEHYTNALSIKSILNSVYFMKYVDLWLGSVGVLSGAVSVCCSCLSVRCSLFQLLLHTARLFTFSTCVALPALLVR